VKIEEGTPASVLAVTAFDRRGKELASRVVGAAREEWQGVNLLHVQVDVPSTNYQKGPIRHAGAGARVTFGSTA